MADIIEQLPDAVANQIAAGEVVQRPASAVKELLENAIDSGASEIQLMVKDAGKTLIRVIDNGCGMSDTDARMSFERHATSKIRKAEDLYQIRTKGFRGEALSSIAAVAQVEVKTRLHDQEIGTTIQIAGSEVTNQEACQAPVGTSFSIKNLFFNIPARRKFLKSDAVEMRHIIDEFQRVALVHCDVQFTMHHNDHELFKLLIAPLRQRIVNVFGAKYNQRLVPVSTDTDIVKVNGFIGKSEFARKTRGDQYLFVNHRFIKHPYLHHAVSTAYSQLIPKGYHPTYFLYLELDPAEIDINIHPTKTEIKFRDERSIYAIMHSAVKQAIGKFSLSPTLDFDQESSLQLSDLKEGTVVTMPSISVNPDYNPFKTGGGVSGGGSGKVQPAYASKPIPQNWKDFYDTPSPHVDQTTQPQAAQLPMDGGGEQKNAPVFQLHRKYIVTQIKSGMVVIDQERAHERILYERFLTQLEKGQGSSQQLLFPQQLALGQSEMAALMEYEDQLKQLGFDLGAFGKDTLLIQGIPSEAGEADAKALIEEFVEQIVNQRSKLQVSSHEKLATSMAIGISIKAGKKLGEEEMHNLIDELFACQTPYYSAQGKSTILTLSLEDLAAKF